MDVKKHENKKSLNKRMKNIDGIKIKQKIRPRTQI